MIVQTRFVGLLALGLTAAPAFAVSIFTGGVGGVAFGVSPYGAPVPGVPTYIPNTFNGRTDILSSPGGTYLTANPVVANNIASFGPGPLPGFGAWIGGGNGWGPFGAGAAVISGPNVQFSLSDPIAGGGSASYGIATWNATFADPAGSPGFGTFLSLAGSVPNVGSAAVAALRTRITSANPASPFFGGFEMPQLVLANSQVAPGIFSFVALGGTGAALLSDIFGNFRGLAINNFALPIPAGDVFTAQVTLTFYADPAMFYALDPLTDPALIAATGTTLPNNSLVTTVPEPTAGALVCFGLIGLTRWLKRRET